MKPLKIFSIVAEVTVIASIGAASAHAAFGGVPAGEAVDWLAGAPLLTVAALETLRLPVAFQLPKLRFFGLLLSTAMLAGLTVITGEAASIAFETLLDARARPVVEAETELKKIEISHDSLDTVAARQKAVVEQATADLAAARQHRADIDKPVVLQTVAPDKKCSATVGKGKHARVITWVCNSDIQNKEANGNVEAQAAHNVELKAASDLVAAAQAKLTEAESAKVDMSKSDDDLKLAEQKVADARSSNPMYRVAASWQGTPVQQLTSEQYEHVKHYAVIALATATAVTSALVAVISNLPERGPKGDGKLARAIRGWLAARRKTLRRINERVVTEFKDRTKVVYVPVDVASGKVLDPAFRPGPTSATPNFKVVS